MTNKRSTVACRRCRRLRIKCLQEHGRTPCDPCRKAGPAEAQRCAFTTRGDNADRKFRIKPAPAAASTLNDTISHSPQTIERRSSINHESVVHDENPNQAEGEPSSTNALSPTIARKVEVYSANDLWALLPPHEELVSGCRVFLATCLQVGFIPKALFLEQMETDRDSVPMFLLLCMLGLSARFTPSLCQRFGGSGRNASEFFLDIAGVMVADEMYNTTLENTQAFFLLGMADWGRGSRDRSAISMGIAVRIAGMLRLHREETYSLEASAAPDLVVKAESGRRTFWAIQNHDNLYTRQHLPVSFAKKDITTLLPCSETDFAFGRRPPSRAALVGTVPARRDPALVSLPDRSLFATLIQAHDLWGTIARDVYSGVEEATAVVDDFGPATSPSVSDCKNNEPWLPDSKYACMAATLRDWEADIPPQHRWSTWNLRGYTAERFDLAYLSIVTITRLNNIVLRRQYLEAIFREMVGPTRRRRRGEEEEQENADEATTSTAPPGFWANMARELFHNELHGLFDAVNTWFSLRSPEDGYPAMLALCIYTCGSLASYLVRWPRLRPESPAPAGSYTSGERRPAAIPVVDPESMLRRSLEILSTFEDKWAAVSQWTSLLRRGAPQEEETGRDHQDEDPPPPSPLQTSHHLSSYQATTPGLSQPVLSPTSLARSPANFQPQPCFDAALSMAPTNYSTTGHESLELLRDAAMYESYQMQQQQQQQQQEQLAQQQPMIGLDNSPPDMAVFRETLLGDSDFDDLPVQGYVHFGLTGWE